jgi:hypothetical protein
LTRAPLQWASAGAGFVVAALLTSLALFALLGQKWGMTFPIYQNARLILAACIWFFLLHDAFQQSMLFGALGCFPPFLIVYGALYTESSFLQGAFIATMIFFGLEVLFLEERSLYTAIGQFIQHVIDTGHRWIESTSRA